MACIVSKAGPEFLGGSILTDGGVALDGAEAIERVDVCTEGFVGQTAGHVNYWHYQYLYVYVLDIRTKSSA
jgi:hypothetical protein